MPERERGPYRTLGDVMAQCTPRHREAVEATLQFVCESMEAWYQGWLDTHEVETATCAVYELADRLRGYMDQGEVMSDGSVIPDEAGESS